MPPLRVSLPPKAFEGIRNEGGSPAGSDVTRSTLCGVANLPPFLPGLPCPFYRVLSIVSFLPTIMLFCLHPSGLGRHCSRMKNSTVAICVYVCDRRLLAPATPGPLRLTRRPCPSGGALAHRQLTLHPHYLAHAHVSAATNTTGQTASGENATPRLDDFASS